MQGYVRSEHKSEIVVVLQLNFGSQYQVINQDLKALIMPYWLPAADRFIMWLNNYKHFMIYLIIRGFVFAGESTIALNKFLVVLPEWF